LPKGSNSKAIQKMTSLRSGIKMGLMKKKFDVNKFLTILSKPQKKEKIL